MTRIPVINYPIHHAQKCLITQVYRLPFDLVRFPKQECSKKHVDSPFRSWYNLRGNVLLLLTISNCLYCIFLITKPIHLKFCTQKEDKIVAIHKLFHLWNRHRVHHGADLAGWPQTSPASGSPSVHSHSDRGRRHRYII